MLTSLAPDWKCDADAKYSKKKKKTDIFDKTRVLGYVYVRNVYSERCKYSRFGHVSPVSKFPLTVSIRFYLILFYFFDICFGIFFYRPRAQQIRPWFRVNLITSKKKKNPVGRLVRGSVAD